MRTSPCAIRGNIELNECDTKTKMTRGANKIQANERKKCKNSSFWLNWNANQWCYAWSSCISISLWSVQVSVWCCCHRCFFNLIKWFKVAWCNWRFLFAGWLPLSFWFDMLAVTSSSIQSVEPSGCNDKLANSKCAVFVGDFEWFS